MHVLLVLAGRFLCRKNKPIILEHALYMRAIHGGKSKNEKSIRRRTNIGKTREMLRFRNAQFRGQ